MVSQLGTFGFPVQFSHWQYSQTLADDESAEKFLTQMNYRVESNYANILFRLIAMEKAAVT